MRPGALSPGHSRGSSHRCLFASFSALEKEVTTHSRGRKSLQIPSPSAVAATSPERRGFKIRLTCKQKKLISPLYLNRKTNLNIIINPNSKVFCLLFFKKVRFFQKSRLVGQLHVAVFNPAEFTHKLGKQKIQRRGQNNH